MSEVNGVMIAYCRHVPLFTHLETNVKGYVNVELGPCTAIVGQNQQGKTRILDAIRLALTGKHHIGPNASDIHELTPGEAVNVFSRLTESNGRIHKFEITVEEGRPKKPWKAEYPYAHLLCVDRIGELLTFGSIRLREALIERWGQDRLPEAPLGLNAAQQQLWTQAEGITDNNLADMCKWFRGQAKQANDKIRAIMTTMPVVEDIGYGVEQLPDLERQLLIAEQYETAQAVQVKLAALPTVQFDEGVFAAVANECMQIRALITVGENLTRALQSTSTQTKCPLCCADNVNLAAVRSKLETEIVGHVERLTAKQALLTELTLTKNAHDSAQKQRELLLSQIQSLPMAYAGASASELRAHINQIKQTLLVKKQIETSSRELITLRDMVETCKLLEHESAYLLQEELRKIQYAAESEINKYLIGDLSVQLTITDKSVELRIVGADGRPHARHGMCGEEYASLFVALACAWCPGGVLLLDDTDLGALDQFNLVKLLNMLRESQSRGDIAQVFVGWNRPHEISCDIGWHVINVGGLA
jgi:hypothetical protein